MSDSSQVYDDGPERPPRRKGESDQQYRDRLLRLEALMGTNPVMADTQRILRGESSLPRPRPKIACPICGGSGRTRMESGIERTCPECDGHGWVYGFRKPDGNITSPLLPGMVPMTPEGVQAGHAAQPLTEGTKYDGSKPAFDLIDPAFLLELGKLCGLGAKKYAPENWRKGIEYRRLYDALWRHLLLWWSGEEEAQDDGQHHLVAVAWNAMVLWVYQQAPATYGHLDNRELRQAVIDALNQMPDPIEPEVYPSKVLVPDPSRTWDPPEGTSTPPSEPPA